MQMELQLSHWELHQPASNRAAREAFGLDDRTIRHTVSFGETLTIIATAEQFGTFIALRNSYGGTNRVQTLKPRLIPNPIAAVVDVRAHRLAA